MSGRTRAAALLAAGVMVAASAPGQARAHDFGGAHQGPRVLHAGTPQQAGLVPEYVERIVPDLTRFLEPSPTHPLYAGAVVLAAHDGVVVEHAAIGKAVRYPDGQGTELPADQQVPMRQDTIVDLASVSKLFTSLALVQQVEAGRVHLDEPVATYLPEFATNGKQDVTVEQLLTHTSGLPAWAPLYSRYATKEERLGAVLHSPLESPPGEQYRYSDLGLITVGLVVEKVAGTSLDEVVADGITEPLGMHDTMYNPPASVLDRVAATEYQPWTGRGMVRGSVHDENAWSLGGVAGHAGVFSTAHDLAVLGQALLNGGRYGEVRILTRDSVDALFTDLNAEFPGHAHGLGFEIDQRWYADALSSPSTVGHTGFTGTSLVLDRTTKTMVVLLTNRVHPSRSWGSNNPARRVVAHDMALAMPVTPRRGPDAWFSGTGDARTATLTLPLTLPGDSGPGDGRPLALRFALFVDTETAYDDSSAPDDVVALDLSLDGGRTWSERGSWSGYHGRAWRQVTAELTGLHGDVLVRWRYETDASYQGRGVYVDDVVVGAADGEDDAGHAGVLFDGERPADAGRFVSDGWVRSRA